MLLREKRCHCCLIQYRGIGLESRTVEDGDTREEEQDGSKLKFFLSFIYLWLHCVFVAAHGLSPVLMSQGCSLVVV